MGASGSVPELDPEQINAIGEAVDTGLKEYLPAYKETVTKLLGNAKFATADVAALDKEAKKLLEKSGKKLGPVKEAVVNSISPSLKPKVLEKVNSNEKAAKLPDKMKDKAADKAIDAAVDAAVDAALKKYAENLKKGETKEMKEEKPAEKPVEKPVEKKEEKPVEKPIEKPIEKFTEHVPSSHSVVEGHSHEKSASVDVPMKPKKPENVLVAIDGSEHSTRALKTAIDTFVRKDIDHVYVLFVKEPLHEGVFEMLSDEDKAQAVENEKNRVDKLISLANEICSQAGVKHTVYVAEGNPKKEIIKEIDGKKADILVVGRRGATGPKDMTLGSISRFVIAEVKIPVLIVK
jgi:nucleotide-binding universal stress UspA family protein